MYNSLNYYKFAIFAVVLSCILVLARTNSAFLIDTSDINL